MFLIIVLFADLPVFRVEFSELWPLDGLDGPPPGGPGTLNIVLYSKNQKGASDAVILENIAFNDAERRTGKFSIYSNAKI